MQAPKHELFLLNWEIFDLNKKLKTFTNVYSVMDIWTVDCLSQLIATVDTIMTSTSIKPYGEWDKKDENIFQGYSFHHSINCKQCGRAVKISKPSLLKHLKECNATTKECTSKKEFIEEVLEIALCTNNKKHGNEIRTTSPGSSVRSKRDKSSQSTSTVASKQNRPKQVDSQKKLNEHNSKTKSTVRSMRFGVLRSKSDTSAQSNSTVSSIQNGPKEVEKPKKVNEHHPKKGTENGNVPKILRERMLALSTSDNSVLKNKTIQTASKKTQKHDEPKRKIHTPNRAKDGEYVTIGSIPNNKVELTKKTKNFIINVKPQTHLMVVDACRKELSNSPAHDNIVKTLEDLFKTSYPKAKAYPFGSRITGLGKETSDLDIYLDLEGNYNGSQKYSKDKLKRCVLLTEEHLKLSDQWSKLDPITSARTPILRAWNTKEKIDCDISFTHGLSHCNTKLIQYLFDLQPVCYYVALYAKEWSRNFNMDGLNTYTLVLLTIFYFQKHNLLPSIHILQKSCMDPMFISHWQANFESKSLEELKIPKIPETEAEKHIMKFFFFYGSKFSFDTRVVCPLLGWAPQKEDFDPVDCELPMEMENLQKYYNKLDMKLAHPVNDLLSYRKPMVVQDPFELNHNVAKGVSPDNVNRFRKFCALTAALLDTVWSETA